jgi:N utilization substance protein B
MGARHRARQYAVQVLFQLDVTGEDPGDALAGFWESRDPVPAVRSFTEELVCGSWEQREHLDSVLEESAANWKVSRMAMVDRNVLRLALYELLHGQGTPSPVVLDEAIELGKQFGNADSGPFINGILDAVRRRLDDGSLSPVPPAP